MRNKQVKLRVKGLDSAVRPAWLEFGGFLAVCYLRQVTETF